MIHFSPENQENINSDSFSESHKNNKNEAPQIYYQWTTLKYVGQEFEYGNTKDEHKGDIKVNARETDF